MLSNCVNSGIRQITVLTQYKAQSLIQHIHRGWGYMRGEFGEFVEVIPAQQKTGNHWYRGTADAVYQNIDVMHAHRPKHVLVLAGDHIYKMDYGPMIAYHVEKGADITVGVVEVPIAEAREFGVLTVTEWNRVTRFVEKSPTPDPDARAARTSALASMGIYVFNPELLEKLLIEDAADEKSKHDFGKNIIPKAIEKLQVFAYPFRDVKTRAQSYWRDVGTIDAFYEANLELVWVNPELNIYDEDWPIWTYQAQTPPAKFVLDEDGRRGIAINSLVSGGVIISGATVRESLLFSGVRVEERSHRRTLGDPARRAHRPELPDPQCHHRRELRDRSRHAHRFRSCRRREAIPGHRKGRGAGDARHAGAWPSVNEPARALRGRWCWSGAVASGCASAFKFEAPKLSVVSMKVQSADIFSQRLQVRMRVLNPNDRELPIKGINYRIEVNDAELAQGLTDTPFVVPAMGEAEFDVQVTANLATALSQFLSRQRFVGHARLPADRATWRYPAAFCGAFPSMSAAASS